MSWETTFTLQPYFFSEAEKRVAEFEGLNALGIGLPATAEPEGYRAEKAKGNIKVLPPGGQFHCQLEVGTLAPDEAGDLEDQINQIVGG